MADFKFQFSKTRNRLINNTSNTHDTMQNNISILFLNKISGYSSGAIIILPGILLLKWPAVKKSKYDKVVISYQGL